MDLAFTYYKLSEYDNPLEIESLLNCMRRAIVRSLMGKNHNSTSDLKQKIKDILRQTNAKFSETDFDKNWRDFYVDERCPIVHRSGSKLVCSNIFRIRQDIKQSSMMYKVGLVLSYKPIQKMKKPILLKRSSRINSTAYVK